MIGDDEPFGDAYASAYDALYADKDYAAECDTLAALLGDGTRLLDLGCGTGTHAIELARRGFFVTGVDRSRAMLDAARGKAEAAGVGVTLLHGDLRALDVAGAPFDAALMMFAVLGYLCAPDDLDRALAGVRRHVRPGAPFVFDVWYGPAVLKQRPGARRKAVRAGDRRIERQAAATLDPDRRMVRVDYRLDVDGATTVERHDMRYFFPEELAPLLARAGFSLERLRTIADDRAPGEDDWSALIVARAR